MIGRVCRFVGWCVSLFSRVVAVGVVFAASTRQWVRYNLSRVQQDGRAEVALCERFLV